MKQIPSQCIDNIIVQSVRPDGVVLVRNDQAGISLFEIIVSVALFAILAAIAIPHIHGLSDVIGKRSAEIQVLHDLRFAQAMSVEQGCRGVLKIDADGKGYRFGCDYVPFHASEAPDWDRILKIQSLPAGISLSVDQTIFFNSRGEVIDSYGIMTQRSLILSVNQTVFSTGVLRPNGFFEYTD